MAQLSQSPDTTPLLLYNNRPGLINFEADIINEFHKQKQSTDPAFGLGRWARYTIARLHRSDNILIQLLQERNEIGEDNTYTLENVLTKYIDHIIIESPPDSCEYVKYNYAQYKLDAIDKILCIHESAEVKLEKITGIIKEDPEYDNK